MTERCTPAAVGRASGLRSRHWYSRSWIACGQSSGTLRQAQSPGRIRLENEQATTCFLVAMTLLEEDQAVQGLPAASLHQSWQVWIRCDDERSQHQRALGLAPPVLCRQQPRQQLVQHDAQGPDVGGGGRRQPVDDLWRLHAPTTTTRSPSIAACSCHPQRAPHRVVNQQLTQAAAPERGGPLLQGMQVATHVWHAAQA
jgi:hypothetical protein